MDLADNPVLTRLYRVSLASSTAHSETPNKSILNNEMIDAVILIFVLFNFGGLQLQPFPLFGDFPTWFQGTMHMRIDVRVALKCFIFSETVLYIPDPICLISYITLRHTFPTAVDINSLVQRPVPNLSGTIPRFKDESKRRDLKLGLASKLVQLEEPVTVRRETISSIDRVRYSSRGASRLWSPLVTGL